MLLTEVSNRSRVNLSILFSEEKLAGAHMYTLCVSGAVNTQGFVWTFFMHYKYKKHKKRKEKKGKIIYSKVSQHGCFKGNVGEASQ